MRIVVGALGATIGAVGAVGAARGAVVTSAVSAPYASAEHDSYMSCSSGQLMPSCSASAGADRRHGAISVTAGVDSGAGGIVPSTAESIAAGQVSPTVVMGNATAATFSFHVRVRRAGATATGIGRSDELVWASAFCEQCAIPYDAYGHPTGPEDETLIVTLVRGIHGGQIAQLSLGTYADAQIACGDSCVAPNGTAKAFVDAILTGIDVRLWGTGTPAAPVFLQPASGATVSPATFQNPCDTQCQAFTGERITGTAEPGMPVQVLDGKSVVALVQADDAGRWVAYVTLSTGSHTLNAKAIGPQGAALSSPRAFDVRG